MRKTVILFGPKIAFENAKYGGGTGGYTRNMVTYLSSFKSEEFQMAPSFHSVRTSGNHNFPGKVYRLFRDVFCFTKDVCKYKNPLVHLLAQYRGAIAREFMITLVCRLFRLNYVYEIKAGEFDSWFSGTTKINQFMVKKIVQNSSLILVEGMRYKHFLLRQFNLDSVYWPNFVDSKEIPSIDECCTRYFDSGNSSLVPFNVTFTGYCYEGKGVFELIESLNYVAKHRLIYIQLDLIGQESEPFTEFLNTFSFSEYFRVNRHGKVPHSMVLTILKNSHLFCLPSKHKGEGHNNSINEAFMLNIPVMTTKHGFSEDVLKNGRGWLINNLTIDSLSESIINFIDESNEIPKRIDKAKLFFNENLHSDVVMPKLVKLYLSIEENNK